MEGMDLGTIYTLSKEPSIAANMDVVKTRPGAIITMRADSLNFVKNYYSYSSTSEQIYEAYYLTSKPIVGNSLTDSVL